MVAGRHTHAARRLIAATLLGTAAGLASGAGEVDPALRAALVAAVERSESFDDRFDAEVWLTDFAGRLQRFVPDPAERIELLRMIHAEAAAADVPPELVLGVIEIESAFDRYAISHAGALGLMQIMPFWVREIGRPQDNLFDPRTNLRYGCTILRHYLDRERGDLRRALGRYNGLIRRNPYPDKVLDAVRERWFRQ